MSTYGHITATPVFDNRTVQYQEKATPPEFPQLPAPTTAFAYFPDRIELRRPQHPQPVLGVGVTDKKWQAVYPEQFRRREMREGWLARNVEPISEVVVPDKGFSAVFPDRLEPYRLREGWFAQNVEPIPNPDTATDLGQRAFFPDRLPPIPPTPGAFSVNVEPIPNPPAPEGVAAKFPSRLVRARQPQPPTFFFDFSPASFFQQTDYSRGLHVGDVRGFYHTPDIATAAPWAVAVNTPSAQTFTNGIETVVDLTGKAGRSGFGNATDMDPWGMIDAANDKIVFSHDGYYIVSFNTAALWEGTATGSFRVRIMYFLPTGVAQREVIRDTRQYPSGINSPGLTMTSDIQPFARGGWVQVLITQNTSGNQTLGASFFSVVRVAGPTLVLPT